jgi:hypothetical protein
VKCEQLCLSVQLCAADSTLLKSCLVSVAINNVSALSVGVLNHVYLAGVVPSRSMLFNTSVAHIEAAMVIK